MHSAIPFAFSSLPLVFMCIMTLVIPIPATSDTSLPLSPSYLVPSTNPSKDIHRAVHSILDAKRIVIICGKPSLSFSLHAYLTVCVGAGVSVLAGIPDFRSPTGLFHTLTKEYPGISTGMKMFDASVLEVSQTSLCMHRTPGGLAIPRLLASYSHCMSISEPLI